MLAACVGWLKWQPGIDLVAHRPVVAVDGERGQVRFADGRVLDADGVLVAVGPWARGLLPDRVAKTLTLHRQSLLYCRAPGEQAEAWAATPAIPALGTRRGAWLIPPVAGTALKVTSAALCREVDALTDHRTPEEYQRELAAEFGDLLPGFSPAWVLGSKDCYYLSYSGTGGPLVVSLGGSAHAYAACGGSSFKFAPLIARTLADRVLRRTPDPTGLTALDTTPLDASP
ncbi:FAD-dependent oxidoreductase [Streptomyces hirsutus]